MVMSTLPRRALVGLVRGYRVLLSPWLGNTCRFEPSCSAYSIDALTKHGATAGTYLTAFPADADRPLASNLNVVPGEAVPNLSVVGLSTDNKFKVFNFAGGVDYIFDVVARIAK